MKKSFILLASLAIFSVFSCKESAASKVELSKEVAAKERDAILSVYPEITFDALEYDFGELSQGTHVEHLFTYTNTGEVPLVITNATSTCGCTVPKYTKDAVAPGEKGELLVKFDGSGRGMVSKTITLSTNTEKGQETLRIKANVAP